MKRHVLLTLVASVFFSFALTAQTNVTKAGKFTASTGIGVLTTYFKDGATTNVPPLSLRAGYIFGKHFSLNAYFGYSATTASPRLFDDGLRTQIENSSIVGGLRGEFRHNITEKLEFYGGGMLGLSHSNIKEVETETGKAINRSPDEPTPYNPNPPKSAFLYTGFVGTTYFIQPKFGVYTELGYGISLITAGFTIRM
ncbi:MAG: hypothetical protein ACE5FF_01840 [Saprospiraceae bacterium]